MRKVFQPLAMSFLLLLCAQTATAQPASRPAPAGTWRAIAPLPEREGFAGPFAGTSNGALIVAGGANFLDKKPWQGGTKRYYDTIYVLQRPDAAWTVAGKLPHPTAYGVSIDVPHGTLCIGGNGDEQNYADVYLLEWVGGAVKKTDWPSLPQPITMACGALVDSTIFIACGNLTAVSGKVSETTSLWSLDLNDLKSGWTKREALPGTARAQAVAAAQDGAFFVISGIATTTGADGKTKIQYLSDAYRYDPGGSTGRWTRLADLPHPNAAAPSPAPPLGNNKIVLLGEGAQGKHLDIPIQDRPRLSGDSLIYNLDTNAWQAIDPVPFGVVCAPVTNWNGQVVVVNGEIRGGIRTPDVRMGTLSEQVQR